ncbi:MAG: diaminopimelate decarboxylase [Ruminococcaceae bacterium]|nr:diaminopimelate decarboxylase [Oscillospiraceae bacterium]
MLHDNIKVLENGHLAFGGSDVVELAEKYGTPLYVTDEAKIRSNFREYKAAVEKYFGKESLPLYASKALCCKEIYRIAKDEGVGTDVVSGGELYTALSVGFPSEKIYFHGNNKTEADINYALDNNIGGFVVDNFDELVYLNAQAGGRNKVQPILLRLSPGIDPHTHRAVVTGSVDSKFGVAIETGQALEFVKTALECKNLQLEGIHCHIGSQIFDKFPFTDAARIMLDFAVEVKNKLDFTFKKINLGGGIGVRYTEKHPVVTVDEILREIKNELDIMVSERGLESPIFLFEMGRFCVANAGMTLYTVGAFKQITGYKNYVCIDGGMPDNPRYALYESEYTVYNGSKANLPRNITASVAGRCCESGDLIGEDMQVQEFSRGDILAVAVTGAYNYSMASHYNRIPKPAMVSVNNGVDKLIIKRETYEDILKNEI